MVEILPSSLKTQTTLCWRQTFPFVGTGKKFPPYFLSPVGYNFSSLWLFCVCLCVFLSFSIIFLLSCIIWILVITVKISIEKRLLLCETLVNKKYKGLTSGLMGNFDDIESNDFMLPNGTELNENATKTERDIFYNFGQHCKFIFILNFYH